MSTIGVKYHNEDIHNIIRQPSSPPIKPPEDKSKKRFLIEKIKSGRSKYNGHQTFGLARYEPPNPCNFVKKQNPKNVLTGVKFLDREEFKCTIHKKSPLPKPNYQKANYKKKNFVKENIKKIATLEPKKPCPRRVETPRGTVKDLAHLIQMIKVRDSEEYGKLPKYLCERRKRWEKERWNRQYEENAVREYKQKMGIGTMGMSENVYMIDQETRQKLLDGLKENWNELSKQFLKLPVIIDTWTKIKRKTWLEKEIDQLEEDVKLIERHPYIYLERSDKRTYEEIIAEMNSKKEQAEQKDTKEPEAEAAPEPESAEEKKEIKEENTNETPAEEKKEEVAETNN